jgi:hypothetical protein
MDWQKKVQEVKKEKNKNNNSKANKSTFFQKKLDDPEFSFEADKEIYNGTMK